jgi:acyl carrier protein
MTEQVRRILKEHARLAGPIESLSDDGDLYRAGMTSQASVNVMLALEGAFDIEFPDHMLKRSVFASVAAIREAVEELTAKNR